ncbi:MAG TPA: VOC family protein, partial [Acidimicrobiales bacterium]|nr:VOC family protein [Acidimicrobiales bacterium]
MTDPPNSHSRGDTVEILSGRTIIHPTDLERTLAFYQDGFGLAVAREFSAGATRGVVFFLGGGLLEVVGHHGNTIDEDQPGAGEV